MLVTLNPETAGPRRSLEQVAPPAAEPVSLADAKAHLRLDTDAEDGLLAGLLTAARERVEAAAGRSFLSQGWVLALDAWPAARAWVDLPRPPLQQVNTVRLYTADGGVTVWPAEAYFADLTAAPGRLILRTGEIWPLPGRPLRGIEIDYTAGYGPDPEDLPGPLRQAVLMELARGYEARGDGRPDGAAPWAGLIEPYRVRRL